MKNTQRVFVLVLTIVMVLGVSFLLSETDESAQHVAEEEFDTAVATSSVVTIGASVEGRLIEAHRFGTGETTVLFVGGIHGGYEANTANLAYEIITAFESGEIVVPKNITVHVIPLLNPDGYARATDATTNYTDEQMRFNARSVDLNRNFDCRWQPTSSWRGVEVSAGSAVFSEPEAVTLRDYVNKISPVAAVFWHSQAGTVYGSECGAGASSETLKLVTTYAQAAGYEIEPRFDAYDVTGAAEDWLASQGIPAVTVELDSQTDSEFTKNKAGTISVLQLYTK